MTDEKKHIADLVEYIQTNPDTFGSTAEFVGQIGAAIESYHDDLIEKGMGVLSFAGVPMDVAAEGLHKLSPFYQLAGLAALQQVLVRTMREAHARGGSTFETFECTEKELGEAIAKILAIGRACGNKLIDAKDLDEVLAEPMIPQMDSDEGLPA